VSINLISMVLRCVFHFVYYCSSGLNSSSSHYSSHRSTSDSTARRPAHGSASRHEVVLKTLPFYDVLTEIMKPFSLGNYLHSFLSLIIINRL